MIELKEQITLDDVFSGMLAAGCFAADKPIGGAALPVTPQERYRTLVDRGLLFLRFLPHCDWRRAVIHCVADLEQLLLICEESWFEAPATVDRRLVRWADLEGVPAPHRQRVEAMVKAGLPTAALDRRVTLFGHDAQGPFSILDGNHRLLALAHGCRSGRWAFEPFAVHVALSFGPCRWHGDPVVWDERPPRDDGQRFVLRGW